MLEIFLLTASVFVLTLGALRFANRSAHRRTFAPAKQLASRFVSLGDLAGKTKDEITSAVGTPNSSSAIGSDTTLAQWIVPGYHIALVFKGEICQGVQHESGGEPGAPAPPRNTTPPPLPSIPTGYCPDCRVPAVGEIRYNQARLECPRCGKVIGIRA